MCLKEGDGGSVVAKEFIVRKVTRSGVVARSEVRREVEDCSPLRERKGKEEKGRKKYLAS